MAANDMEKNEKPQKTQWHPAFTASIKLELKDDRDIFDIGGVLEVGHLPLQADMHVLRKSGGRKIPCSVVAKKFKGHNLFEFKSAFDHLDLDTFAKGHGTAELYKAGADILDNEKGFLFRYRCAGFAMPRKRHYSYANPCAYYTR